MTVKEYVYAPRAIKAIQFTGDNFEELVAFAHALDILNFSFTVRFHGKQTSKDKGLVLLLELNGSVVNPGSYILEVDGRLRAMAEKDFNEFYREANNNDRTPTARE